MSTPHTWVETAVRPRVEPQEPHEEQLSGGKVGRAGHRPWCPCTSRGLRRVAAGQRRSPPPDALPTAPPVTRPRDGRTRAHRRWHPMFTAAPNWE